MTIIQRLRRISIVCTSLNLHPRKVKRLLFPAKLFTAPALLATAPTAPFITYLLSLNVNATPGLPSLELDTYNKGHSVVLCRRIAALYGLQVARVLRRLDFVLSTTFTHQEEEREIRFGCSGEIQLFTGTNPVTELVATGETGVTPCRATSRLYSWHYTGACGVTISSWHYTRQSQYQTPLMTLL